MTDPQPELGVVQAHPAAGFAAAAGAELGDAAEHVSQMVEAAESGDLVLDDEVGPKVLRALERLRDRVDALVDESPNLDEPLLLGNNFVAGVMDRRLQEAASGSETGAAIPVLREFQRVMHTYEHAVRKAMSDQREADEEAGAQLRGLERELGGEGGELR